jgi:hypothetical protein
MAIINGSFPFRAMVLIDNATGQCNWRFCAAASFALSPTLGFARRRVDTPKTV